MRYSLGVRVMVKVSDMNKSGKKRRKILSDPQIGHGIFTKLASMILPVNILAIAKT